MIEQRVEVAFELTRLETSVGADRTEVLASLGELVCASRRHIRGLGADIHVVVRIRRAFDGHEYFVTRQNLAPWQIAVVFGKPKTLLALSPVQCGLGGNVERVKPFFFLLALHHGLGDDEAERVKNFRRCTAG